MKSHSTFPISTVLLSGVAPGPHTTGIPLADCPAPVRDIVLDHLQSGRIVTIQEVRRQRRALYLVEIDLPGARVRKLQVTADGSVFAIADEIRVSDLPRPVQSALDSFLTSGARFDTAERVSASGEREYHVELDLGDEVDLHLFLDEGGEVLRRHEVADF